MTTGLEIVKGALKRINSYAPGDALASIDANDCLETLNDLLDSLSIDKQFVFGSNEWIMQWIAGKTSYLIGNPTNDQLGNNTAITQNSQSGQQYTAFPNTTAGVTYPNIVGYCTIGSPTISQVTSFPTNLVAGSTPAYALGSGSILSDVQGLIPPNTTVLSFNVGAQTITMSANATGSSPNPNSIGYTIPGDFPIPRPLRITHGFTRFNALDFELNVAETQEQYTSILYKQQAGPWPTVAWYNNTFPYGILNAYQSPGNNAELHLFVDTILNRLSLTQNVSMPQGYVRMLKWLLAKEICAEYGFPLSEAIKTNAQEAKDFVKALNARPAQVARYDRELARGNRADAGWILTGGMS